MTTRTATRPKLKKLTEPTKRWRNRWRARCRCTEDGGTKRVADEVFSGSSTHPSRDVAESKAYEDLAEDVRRHGVIICDYLGAFPVEAS